MAVLHKILSLRPPSGESRVMTIDNVYFSNREGDESLQTFA